MSRERLSLEVAGPTEGLGRQRGLWQSVDALLEPLLIIIFYSYFCLIILFEVTRRYVFGASSIWGEMTARYAFVFLVYVAVAEVAKNRAHIRIDLLPQKLSARGRFFLYLYFDVLVIALAFLVIFYSVEIMGLSWQNNVLMTGFDLNMAYAQAALPIGWLLLVYRVAQRFCRTLDVYRRTGDVPLGGGGIDV